MFYFRLSQHHLFPSSSSASSFVPRREITSFRGRTKHLQYINLSDRHCRCKLLEWTDRTKWLCSYIY
jgi:hypothetical protein